ncbi:MAG: hypothetical protein ABSD74_13170 [Rhizomicrobium sp.]|jgi:hypothetical protein
MNPEPGHHHEPHKTGHNWLDMAVAVTALLISLTSLIVAFVHSKTLERMADANARLVETNSWPFLTYGTGNETDVYLDVVNDGVGPAKIEAADVTWKGKAQRNPVELLEACCGFVPKTADLSMGFISGRVLRAGQKITFLSMPSTPSDTAAWKRFEQARLSPDLSINVCYCSVFDECWVEDLVRLSLRPTPVGRCTVPPVPYGLPPK